VPINRLIDDELTYDFDAMQSESEMLISRLNDDQLHAFKTIIEIVLTKRPGFYFVSGYGGTGKTYLWNSIITFLCSRKHIVLSVASSGVASLLLPGVRTTHSHFKIPCELDEGTICDIKRGTMLCELIQTTSLIIWDEALMTH
jgi:DNA replication protein DnaC